jgi:hypothetical protein
VFDDRLQEAGEECVPNSSISFWLSKGETCRGGPGSSHMGFVVDKVELGQVSSEYSSFPCQLSFHRLLHIHHHLSSGAVTIGQLVATFQVDSVLPHPKKLKKDGGWWRLEMHKQWAKWDRVHLYCGIKWGYYTSPDERKVLRTGGVTSGRKNLGDITTTPIWNAMGLNPSLHYEKPTDKQSWLMTRPLHP